MNITQEKNYLQSSHLRFPNLRDKSGNFILHSPNLLIGFFSTFFRKDFKLSKFTSLTISHLSLSICTSKAYSHLYLLLLIFDEKYSSHPQKNGSPEIFWSVDIKSAFIFISSIILSEFSWIDKSIFSSEIILFTCYLK